MQDVSLDNEAAAALRSVRERVCVRDTHGRLLGYFWPAMESGGKFHGMGLSEAEIKRRLNEPGGRSLAEILTDLEKKA